jgi:hypothetical protein
MFGNTALLCEELRFGFSVILKIHTVLEERS